MGCAGRAQVEARRVGIVLDVTWCFDGMPYIFCTAGASFSIDSLCRHAFFLFASLGACHVPLSTADGSHPLYYSMVIRPRVRENFAWITAPAKAGG